MLKSLSIKDLYVLALAEGEGVGTAYEYVAKRLALAGWLARVGQPARILLAGLPEKYGCSLDFLQLASELGADVTVVDERPSALQKLHSSLKAAQQAGWLTAVMPTFTQVTDMAALDEIAGPFDLCISSEVVQRLDPAERGRYAARLAALGMAVALFTPNGDNPAHTHISGLSGLALAELQALFTDLLSPTLHFKAGYIDMPPFPPGITRSDEQREQATSGRMEALAMWGLGYYARAEKLLPTAVRRSKSHIVFILVQREP
ncbi:MAG: class I SAM-dependent methyltransferase [Chloroflexi bacterium]|nr:class I SAM-dependent methyltransferase [Chloroflexota bacterium]